MKIFALLLLLLLSTISYAERLPKPDHIVIVIEENRSFDQIIGSPDAPYVNSLVQRGMLFLDSHGVTHPSQPNYLAFFAGTTGGIGSNVCPLDLNWSNLAGVLIDNGLSFASYSESLPATGADDCVYGAYRRKHNPVANWKNLAALNQPFTAFPQDFSKLPTVSFVIPDQLNDMHDGSVSQGDNWLRQNLDAYARWAESNNSLLIVTWDEDNGVAGNRIATIFVGQMVRHGKSRQWIGHYNILRTVEEMYGLSRLGESADAQPIVDVWK